MLTHASRGVPAAWGAARRWPLSPVLFPTSFSGRYHCTGNAKCGCHMFRQRAHQEHAASSERAAGAVSTPLLSACQSGSRGWLLTVNVPLVALKWHPWTHATATVIACRCQKSLSAYLETKRAEFPRWAAWRGLWPAHAPGPNLPLEGTKATCV